MELIIHFTFIHKKPIYILSEDHDHEIVRTRETYPKAMPMEFKVGFSVLMGLQCSVKDMSNWALNQM